MSKPKRVEFSQRETGVEKGEKPEFGQKRRVLCASFIGAAGLGLLALFSGCNSKKAEDARPEPPAASTAQQDMQNLAARLSDPDCLVAAKAALELGKLGDSRAIPLIASMDEHDCMECIEAAVEALKMFDIGQVMPVLMDMLRQYPIGEPDRDFPSGIPGNLFGAVPGQVYQFLWQSVRLEAAYLLSALDEPNPILKARVASIIKTAVEYYGADPAIFGPKLMHLLSDPESIVRQEAAFALGVLKYAPAARELERRLVGDPSWVARSNAARALGEICDPLSEPVLLDALEDENSVVRGHAAQALGKLKSESAIQWLIEESGRSYAIEIGGALISIGQPAVQPLIRALDDPNPRTRIHSAVTLAAICDVSAIEPLKRVSNEDPDPDVRSTASYAANRIAQGCP